MLSLNSVHISLLSDVANHDVSEGRNLGAAHSKAHQPLCDVLINKGQLLTFWALAFLMSYTCLVTQMVHYYRDTQQVLFYRSYCIHALHLL